MIHKFTLVNLVNLGEIEKMNRERMLSIFQNLLMEMQEHKLINNKGNHKIMRCLIDNSKKNDEK